MQQQQQHQLLWIDDPAHPTRPVCTYSAVSIEDVTLIQPEGVFAGRCVDPWGLLRQRRRCRLAEIVILQ